MLIKLPSTAANLTQLAEKFSEKLFANFPEQLLGLAEEISNNRVTVIILSNHTCCQR